MKPARATLALLTRLRSPLIEGSQWDHPAHRKYEVSA